jgi:hypothetical protein
MAWRFQARPQPSFGDRPGRPNKKSAAPRQRTRQLRDEGVTAVVMNQHVHSILRCAMSRKHNRASAKVWHCPQTTKSLRHSERLCHSERSEESSPRTFPLFVILSAAKNLALQSPHPDPSGNALRMTTKSPCHSERSEESFPRTFPLFVILSTAKNLAVQSPHPDPSGNALRMTTKSHCHSERLCHSERSEESRASATRNTKILRATPSG